MTDIEYIKKSMRRKSSVRRGQKQPDDLDEQGVTVFSRPDDNMDISKFKLEDYKIVKHVGRGTFGKVYLVKNNQTS